MAWDFINKIFAIKPVEKPNFEEMKLVWNDAAKIETKVHEIVTECLGISPEKVKSETKWYPDLIASLEIEDIFMTCEQEFGVDIPEHPDDEKGEWNTVGQLTRYIQRIFGVETPI